MGYILSSVLNLLPFFSCTSPPTETGILDPHAVDLGYESDLFDEHDEPDEPDERDHSKTGGGSGDSAEEQGAFAVSVCMHVYVF